MEDTLILILICIVAVYSIVWTLVVDKKKVSKILKEVHDELGVLPEDIGKHED